ncbi:GntR family transcriptional regulator [Actinokineospora sp. UTMC 2448]|uniref:GntR family transcriptional regulator n=1 Tax=Actinokineospora sp. UTMC 2448 TaxID=2268449 RepID=UPI002164AB52|nr:GntR family transcriptional regulator [Actinokineospora sp. UTMC 2448]UVS80083.1 HTH-type transcriptional repressor PhnF [Actinokineospora sp. UTMC 2448]
MAARTLDRAGARPLWRQLQDDLIERLRIGEFADGFPGELALVEDYGVSRHTVRQALRKLRADGMVTAERGRQPRVSPAADIVQPLGVLYSLFSSVEGTGLAQRSVVQTIGLRADAVVADRLGLEGSTPLVHIERVRYAGDDPLAIDRVWLPAAIAEPILDADFSHTSLYTVLAERTGLRLDRGEETIRAVLPTPGERTRLGTTPDQAALSIHRLSYAGPHRVEWRHTLVRGDRFALSAETTANYRLTAR